MTAALDLTVRHLRDDDLPAVVELLRATFGRWPKVETSAAPIDHLRWKLGDGRPGVSEHFVGELDGRIVAFQLNHHWRTKVGDREFDVRRGWDSAVHPEVQGRGVMSIMRPAMHAKFVEVPDFFLGGSDHPAIPHIHERLSEERHDFGQRWLVFVRPLTLRAALRTFKLRPGRSPRELFDSLATLRRWRRIDARERTSLPAEHPYSIRTAERFDDRIDAFCAEASQQFDFISVRDKALLNWRYADRRAGDFTIRLATEGDRIIGYSVLRVTNGAGHIADLLALPGRLDVVESLARDAAAQLRGAAPAIECWLFEHHPYVPALQSCGFLGRRRRRQLTYEAVGVLQSEIEVLSDTSTVAHLSVGDIDIV